MVPCVLEETTLFPVYPISVPLSLTTIVAT